MDKRIIVASSVLALLFGAVAAAEDGKVYKWVGAEGEMVFSSEPPPSGTLGVEEVMMPESTPPTKPNPDVGKINERAEEISQELKQKFEQRKRVSAQLSAARSALASARVALAQGETPQEGEVQRIRTGAVRRTAKYFERLDGLKAEVAEAEAEVSRLEGELRALTR